jgi:Na+/proline symporter
VNDFYKRFIKPDASEKQLILMARIFTAVSLGMGAGLGLVLTNAGQAFTLLLLLGAGTGMIYILRWFWWRINAYTEIVAMISSLIISIYFSFIHDGLGIYPFEGWQKIVIGAVLTTAIWIMATFITPPDDDKTLHNFVNKVNPGGPGWSRFTSETTTEPWPVPRGILSMILGCVAVYAFLLGVGQFIYGETNSALLICSIGAVSAFSLSKLWK